jgi:putative transposase
MKNIVKKEAIRNWLKNKPVGQAFQPAQLAIYSHDLRKFIKKDLNTVYYRKRKLPHWELEGSTYFITFRVAKNVGQAFQPAHFQLTPDIIHPASIVEETLLFGYGERYLLHAYVIMPDHVHLLITPLAPYTLAKILQGIKGYTAREINKILSRQSTFWQDENFDHLIRNEENWEDKFQYIHHNPVKAGLVENPQDYPFSSMVTLYPKGRLESLPHRT